MSDVLCGVFLCGRLASGFTALLVAHWETLLRADVILPEVDDRPIKEAAFCDSACSVWVTR